MSDADVVLDLPWRAPEAAFAALADAPFAALLDDREGSGWGGATIVAAPARRLVWRGGETRIDGRRVAADPFTALSGLLAGRRRAPRAGFAGGAVGFVGYEAGGLVEPTARGPASPYDLPDLAFGVYDAAAQFDRRARRLTVRGRSRAAVADLAARLDGRAPPAAPPPPFRREGASLDRAAYVAAVAAMREAILDGDYCQANLSRRIVYRCDGAASPLALYARLAADAAPRFGALMTTDGGAILSLSPERFFRIRPEGAAMRVFADPIKGTGPRDPDPAVDARLAEALAASAKDRAENAMIADLTRNDLSRLCVDGTLREDYVARPVAFVRVRHLISRLSGDLRPDVGAVDVLKAMFPCGSITGAPRVAAMQAIAAAEGAGRGPCYGGVGWIDDGGAAAFSVAIRTAVLDEGGARLSMSVGGGVTWRSDPQAEYEETELKARAAFSALPVAAPTSLAS